MVRKVSLPPIDPRFAGLVLMLHGAWLVVVLAFVGMAGAMSGIFAVVAAHLAERAAPLWPVGALALGLNALFVVPVVAFGLTSVLAGGLLRADHPWGRPMAAAMAILSVFVNPFGPIVTGIVLLALWEPRERGVGRV